MDELLLSKSHIIALISFSSCLLKLRFDISLSKFKRILACLPLTDLDRQIGRPLRFLLTEQFVKSHVLNPDGPLQTDKSFPHNLVTDRLNRTMLIQGVKVGDVAVAVVAAVPKQTKQLCCLSMSAWCKHVNNAKLTVLNILRTSHNVWLERILVEKLRETAVG